MESGRQLLTAAWRRRRARDDRGVALLAVIGVSSVVILLSMAAVRQSTDGILQAGHADQQVQASAAAEAGIQFEVAALTDSLAAVAAATTPAAAQFTCPGDPTLSSVGATVSYTLTYVILASAPVRASAATLLADKGSVCSPSAPPTALSTTAPTYVLLQSDPTPAAVGTGTRSVVALLEVDPLLDAVHGNGGVAFGGPATVASVTLSQPLSTTAAITALPVNAFAGVIGAGPVTVSSGTDTQTFTTSGAAAGATTLPITSATPAFAYPVTSLITAASSSVTADIYAGTDELPCTSTGGTVSLSGSIRSPTTGPWTITDACVIGGGVSSGGPIAISTPSAQSPVIGGTIETPAAISVANAPPAPFAVDSGRNLTPVSCPTQFFVASACQDFDPGAVAPAPEAFPAVAASTFPAPAWTPHPATCTTIASTIAAAATVGSGHQLVIVPAGCGVFNSGTGTLTLTNDLAVILPDGLSVTSENSAFGSATPHDLYLVVPSGSTADLSCTGGTAFTGLDVLLYTPGDINCDSTLEGQLYSGGTIDAGPGFALQYVPVAPGTEATDWEYPGG